MEFEAPSKTVYTIYSKSACIYCTKVKKLLQEKNLAFDIIDCDDYLIEDKDNFINYMQILTGREYRTFPMVFCRGEFIGGFSETKVLIEKEEAFRFE